MLGIGGISSQGNLNALNKNMGQILSLQTKLATGKSINSARDNPAGLVISQQLAAQFGSLQQSVENGQRAQNVIDRTEGALGETSNLLIKARGLAVQANDSSLSKEERSALQTELNGILGSIDRISNTTDFAGVQLLNGSQQARVSNLSAGIASVRVDQVGNVDNISRTVDAEITSVATRGALAGASTGQTADVQIRISGALGTSIVNISSGASASDVENAINAVSSETGVEVSGSQVRATEVGSGNFVDIEELSGTLEGISTGRVYGTDVQGTINGQTATGNGNTLSIESSDLTASVTFEETAVAGNFSFSLDSSGFNVALEGGTVGVGIQSSGTYNLGASSGQGNLSSLFTGGDNSLENNASGAISILDSAISEVSSQRARLGAFSSNVIDSHTNIMESAGLSLEAARSRIADTDYAKTIAELTARQIKQQAQTSLQSQIMGLQRNNILSLLGS
jgi:flagellin